MTYLDQFDYIYATGQGKSYQPAALMEILMWKYETDCHALPMDYIGEVSSYIGKNDLLILFSVSGKSEIFQNLSHTSGKLMLVTASAAQDNRLIRLLSFLIQPEIRKLPLFHQFYLISSWSF